MASNPQRHKHISNTDLELPNAEQIVAAVEHARTLLDLGDNWDGEGSPSYSEATLERASDFLIASSVGLWEHYGRVMPLPQIEPGPGGSIDFHWQVGAREILLNLPANSDDMLDFCGDTASGESVKGRAYAATVGSWLLAWLTE